MPYYVDGYIPGGYWPPGYYPRIGTPIIGIPMFAGGISPSYYPGGYYFGNYWSPGYYPRLGLLTTVVAGDESTIMANIVARLIATGCFDAVQLADSEDSVEATQQWTARAVVWPTGGDDVDDAMSYAEDTIRKGRFEILIEVADLEPGDRQAEISRLNAFAKSALNHKSLGGQTFPAWTMIRTDTRRGANHPHSSIRLVGEFAYLASGDNFADVYE